MTPARGEEFVHRVCGVISDADSPFFQSGLVQMFNGRKLSPNESVSTFLTLVESQMEDAPIERKGSRAYQLFPEASMDKDSDYTSYSEEFLYRRERLPSIVVEPSDLGSGEMCLHPQYQISNNVDKEDDNSTENTEIAVDAEPQADIAMEGSMVARKSSIGLSQGQLSVSRLTPPPSPTHPEAAPPCLQNTTSMN